MHMVNNTRLMQILIYLLLYIGALSAIPFFLCRGCVLLKSFFLREKPPVFCVCADELATLCRRRRHRRRCCRRRHRSPNRSRI